MHKISPQRTLTLAGDVNGDMLKSIVERALQWEVDDPKAWTQILLCSAGGWVSAGFGMFDFLTKLTRLKVQTVSLGTTSSMAILIFLAGKHRVAATHTSMFLHELGRTFKQEIRVDLTELNELFRMIHADQELYINILASRSKLSKKEVSTMMKVETTLFARQILKHGLAHEIV